MTPPGPGAGAAAGPRGRAAKWLRATADALQAGELGRAEQYLALLAETSPDDPEYLRLSAIALDQRGEPDDALEAMQRALAVRPDDAVYQNTLATVLTHAGRFDAAGAALERACALEPGLAIAWFNLGIVRQRLGHADAAVAAFRRAAELDPGNPAVGVQLANALRDNGRIEQAAAALRGIVAGAPWAGPAWQALADLKTVPLEAGDLALMQAALKSPRAGIADRIALGYALARGFDEAGRYAEALDALARAKALARGARTWDADGFARYVTAVTGAVAVLPVVPESASRGHEVTSRGHEVIFIVGMPRSGTTLVEQILASHPDVHGAGELVDLQGVLTSESQRRGVAFPDWAPAAGPADWARLGDEYLQRTAPWRRDRPVHTDKLPSNWVFVGAALAMLPAARVVWCTRDPLEGCFACYRQYRAQLDYTGTFEDLAAFWHACDRALQHWRAAAPERVHEHPLEQLQAAPERAVRELLAFCGLAWDPACLAFHANPRAVHTPSATQVRTPLATPMPRALRYGALLDPLRAALHRASSGAR